MLAGVAESVSKARTRRTAQRGQGPDGASQQRDWTEAGINRRFCGACVSRARACFRRGLAVSLLANLDDPRSLVAWSAQP